MAEQSGIDILLNFIVNNKDALKGIISLDSSTKTYTKTIQDSSTTIKDNSKVIHDNSTNIVNKTTIINKNTDAVRSNSMAFAGLGVAVAGVAASIKSLIQETTNVAMEFETQMRNVNSIAKMSEDQFLRMSDAVRETAKMEGVKDTATGIAKAMYQLVSSGFEGAKALEMAGIASKAASAGLTSTETAVTALAAMMNAYNQKTVPDAINFSNQLFTVVDKGVISFEQLATNLGTVLAQASSAKVSFEEVGAAFITLTKAGINASESETAISNLIRTITDPDKGAVKAAAAAGIEFNAMALESKGLKGVLDDLYKATGGNIEAIAKFVPEARSQKAALTLLKGAGLEYVSALDSMKKANEGAGSTQRALNEQMKAASFDIAKMKALIEDLRIEFGNISKSALMPFLKDIKGIIEFVMSLDKETKTLIVQIGLLGAGVTSLMLGIRALGFVFSPLIGFITGLITEQGLLTLSWRGLLVLIGDLAGALGAGGAFAVAATLAVSTIMSLKKIIEGVIEGYKALKDIAGMKVRESALEKESQNAKDLIKLYNQAQKSKEGILKMSAEDLRAASRAFGVRALEVSSPETKKRLMDQALGASAAAKFKEQYEASKKAAAEQADADAKAAARNKQLNAEIEAANKKGTETSKKVAREKTKHQEDYKNEVNRIMEGLAEDEAKRIYDDLNYKVWAENKKYTEERKILDKAFKLKQVTTAQLEAFEKGHTLALLGIWKEYTSEQDKTTKQNETYIAKIREGFTDDEKKRTLSETDFKLYELGKQKAAEKKRIDELITLKVATNKDLEALDIEYNAKEDKIRKEGLEAEKQKEQKLLDLKNQINIQKEQIESSYFSTVIGFIGKFNSGLAQGIQTFQSYFNNVEAINTQRDNTIAKIEKEIDVSTEAGKTNADQLSEAAITNAAMAKTVDTIALVGTIALDWLINSINNYEKLTAEANKYNQTLNDANDWILLITKSIPFVGGLLAAMGKAIGKAFGVEYLEDKAKIQPLLDEISTAERKNVLSDTDFKIEMVNKEYAEKERVLKEGIANNIASEKDLIRLEKLRQAEITKIRLADIEEQKSIKKSISDLNDKENEKFLDDTEKRIIETNREYDEKIKKLKEYIKEGKATNDDLIELENIRNKSIENIFKEKIIDTEKASIQKIYDFEQEAIKKTAKKKKEAAEETIKTYDKELEKAKSTIEKIDEELKKRTKERQQSQESANLFQLKRAQIKSTLPADFERMPIDVFEIKSASQEEQLKQSFALGQISLDQLNKDLMDLAVKKNLFYERIANSLVVGTKEHLDYQKKANDAYSEFASLNEKTTEEQLNQQKKLAEQEQTKYDNLKKQQLKNIDDIENAQTNALIRLENKWKTPAGSFKLSMDEALDLVADKMDAELSNFIDRAKQAISDFKGQKIYDQTSQPPTQEAKTTTKMGAYMDAVTSMVNMTMSDIINKTYEQKAIAENEARAQAAAARFAGFATGGIFDSNKGFGTAMLHDNEMILNPFQQKNLFNLLAAGGGGINVTINTGPVNSQSDINKIASAVSQVIRTDYLRR